MKLSIVIPALNEEGSIGSIIERCLAAAPVLTEKTPLNSVEIIVVSDGSTDRTVEIAEAYMPGIRMIAYRKNKGYGAAIKQGFALAEGEFVAFLDADGTCDPLDFTPMMNKLLEEDADICIGNRLGLRSKMPKVRRLGNRLYATVVSLMGAGRVTDTASGMRILRRESLGAIYPLPDGLNFTPAMSCRAVLDDSLKIVDVPIAYEERVGESKLSVVKDGWRFLTTVLDVSLTYRSFRIMGVLGASFVALGLAYAPFMISYYLRTRDLIDWMIYRAAFITSLIVGGSTFVWVGLLSSRLIRLVHQPRPSGFSRFSSLFSRFDQRMALVFSLAFWAVALAINKPTIQQYFTAGKVYVHWSRVMLGALLALLGFQGIAFAILDRVISLLQRRREPDDSGAAAKEHRKGNPVL